MGGPQRPPRVFRRCRARARSGTRQQRYVGGRINRFHTILTKKPQFALSENHANRPGSTSAAGAQCASILLTDLFAVHVSPIHPSNPTGIPRYIFAGTNATESQRQSRGVLAHWANVAIGVDVTTPVISAKELKAFNQNSSAGKALKFPAQLIGDIFADPNAPKVRPTAKTSSNASELKGLLSEWSSVASEDKAVKAVFGAMKGAKEDELAAPAETDVPSITQFFKPKPQPDGTITHFYKSADVGDKLSYEIVGESIEKLGQSAPAPFAPPARVIPDIRYSDCDASQPANGAARNEAPTSMFGGVV